MQESQGAWKQAIRQVIHDDIDRFATLVVTVIAMVTERTWPFLVGGGLILLLVGRFLFVRVRRAHSKVRTKHVPVVTAIASSADEFRGLKRAVLEVMREFDFDETDYANSYGLESDDYQLHSPARLDPTDRSGWQAQVASARSMVTSLQGRIPGREVLHFFLRAPNAFALGFGAALGTKRECVVHHYQPGAGSSPYLRVLELYGEKMQNQGVHVLKSRLPDPPDLITVERPDSLKAKVFVALGFTGHPPTPVRSLAEEQDASFVSISHKGDGTIGVDEDWLTLTREVSTVLLELVQSEIKELHLYPALPLPLAFGIGMALDTRSRVFVHQWDAATSKYYEVVRLHELANLA